MVCPAQWPAQQIESHPLVPLHLIHHSTQLKFSLLKSSTDLLGRERNVKVLVFRLPATCPSSLWDTCLLTGPFPYMKGNSWGYPILNWSDSWNEMKKKKKAFNFWLQNLGPCSLTLCPLPKVSPPMQKAMQLVDFLFS